MVFDWKSAYETHLKDAHQGIHISPDDSVTKTCSQVVFACGFKSCKQVYEAEADHDAESTAAKYFVHVSNHFDTGATVEDWSYSVRFRNLMRQFLVDEAWKNRVRGKSPQDRHEWQPQTSSVLRKLLETRHVTNANLFVKWAATLGTLSYADRLYGRPMLPAELSLPSPDTCRMAAFGHKPLGYPAAAPSETPPSGAARGVPKPPIPSSPPKSPRTGPTPAVVPAHLAAASLQKRAHLPLSGTSVSAQNEAATAPFQAMPNVPLASIDNHMMDMAQNPDSPPPGHPLLYYNGFTSTVDLPSPEAVIADLERRPPKKFPQSVSAAFPQQLPAQYVNIDAIPVFSDDMEFTADVDMAGCPSHEPTFFGDW